jgi:hypothetical protein
MGELQVGSPQRAVTLDRPPGELAATSSLSPSLSSPIRSAPDAPLQTGAVYLLPQIQRGGPATSARSSFPPRRHGEVGLLCSAARQCAGRRRSTRAQRREGARGRRARGGVRVRARISPALVASMTRELLRAESQWRRTRRALGKPAGLLAASGAGRGCSRARRPWRAAGVSHPETSNFRM